MQYSGFMRLIFVWCFAFFVCINGVVLQQGLHAGVPERAQDNGWLVLRALMSAYPGEIQGLDYDFQIRDWFIVMGSRRLYWAHGRLLPVDHITHWERWSPFIDYLYPPGIPEPEHFDDELIAQLDPDYLAKTRSARLPQHGLFMDILYDGATRIRVEAQIVRIEWLGKRVSVHRKIVAPLRRVEQRIQDSARHDPETRQFLSQILSVEGYNWREIADSPSRSYHSWGLAVDILPKGWGQKNIYWNWISYWNDRWMLIPLDRRWTPPAAVVNAFEAEGFIWGGKWLLWDNMHFEYRPELMQLQRWGHTGYW